MKTYLYKSFPRRRESSLLAYIIIQVPPLRVLLFYQFQFPCPSPFLELLFPCDSIFSSFMDFVINWLLNPIFLCKTLDPTVLVLPYSFNKIRSNSQIKRSISLICQYIYIKLFFHRHSKLSILDSRFRGNDGRVYAHNFNKLVILPDKGSWVSMEQEFQDMSFRLDVVVERLMFLADSKGLTPRHWLALRISQVTVSTS